MITITAENGSLLRTLTDPFDRVFGFHRLFGFISEEASEERLKSRKRHGLAVGGNEWLCRFILVPATGGPRWEIRSVENCRAERKNDGSWLLETAFGRFLFSGASTLDPLRLAQSEAEKQLPWEFGLAFAGLCLLLFWLMPWRKDKEYLPTPPPPDPIEVKVVEQKQHAVIVPTHMPMFQAPKEVARQKPRAGRGAAVDQNLGFLGLLGKKNLSKALGGMPTTLEQATPGAGPGGKEGSGGELLVGLGKGVRRATVGNTGVAGLGGVGHGKGPGGGAGGYGSSWIGSGSGKGIGLASGNGRAISALPLSQDMILEGGLDRAVIQATIAKYISQVRACYEEGLRRNPGMAGQVMMHFEIGGQGALNFARVSRSSLGDAMVEGCIARRMLGWKFPQPLGGVNVKVSYPFLLRPVNS